ncbi:glycosyltransferase family 2 protein [Companilactobacillus furfuricola]|uniref:glycosyltransferase family 2 protein n=1 Tax=Companilactobacillus furfuricola TaxID=1462575 RepID=UPI000F79BC7B
MTLELNKLHRSIKTNIVLINDGSDDHTLARLMKMQHTLASPHTNIYVLNRVLPNARTGKGGALNYGLNFIQNLPTKFDTTHTIIGIVDADGFISADHIKMVIGTFENNPVGMVQTAVSMNSTSHNWLSKMQDVEFLGANSFMQECRNTIGQAIASGNGQFTTLKMAESVKWGNSLLKDFEFTIRGLLQGFKTIFLPQAIVYQEAVQKLVPLWKQRIRWCEGSMQCWVKYSKQLFLSPLVKNIVKTDMLLFLTMPFVSMILNVANSVSAFMQFNNIFKQKLLPVVMVFIIVLMFTLFVWSLIGLEYHQNDHQRSVFTCIFLSWQCIVYNFILSYIPYFAFSYLVTGHVKWDKTAHAQTAHATN